MGVTGKVTSGKSPFSDLPNSDLSYARFSELKSRGVLAESSVRPRETIQLAELVNYFNIAFWSK